VDVASGSIGWVGVEAYLRRRCLVTAMVGSSGSATAAPVVPQGELIMDKDRIQGSVKQVVGSVKEVAGKVLGDQKTEADGKAEKAAGKYRMPSAA
jgi:uncharacterized protein YjbJ (UPF0337 family)